MAIINDLATKQFSGALSRYEEENFFYIASNYLGPISSPFHKPEIIGRLSHFFSLESNQEAMLSLLDELDQAILSTLVASGPITSDELLELLSPIYGYTTLFWRLPSLQLRLILIAEEGRLYFNPLIADRLLERCSLGAIIGEPTVETAEDPTLSVEFLRGYLSVVLAEGRLGYRERLAALFPIFESQQLAALFTLLEEVLVDLGVLTDTRPPQMSAERVDSLLALDDTSLIVLVAASRFDTRHFPAAVACSRTIVATLQQAGSLSEEAFTLLLATLTKRYNLPCTETLSETLQTIGLVRKEEDRYLVNTVGANTEAGTLLVDSDFTISYLGDRPTGDLLYRFATLTSFDVQRQWKIDKESVVRAFDAKIPFAEIEQYLTAHTEGNGSTALLKQLSLLHERYGMLAIYDGLTMVVEERVARIIENLPALQEHLLARLSDTIFLMKRESEEVWRKILSDAGQLVGATIYQSGDCKEAEVLNPNFSAYLSDLNAHIEPLHLNLSAEVSTPVFDEALGAAIEAAKLTKEQKGDLKSRYEQRLIINKSQIAAQVLDSVTEASGLDYQGKLSLCRQAVGKKHIILELWVDGEHLTVWATELTTGGDNEAFLQVSVLPDKDERVIPVRKIFSVRSQRIQLF